MDSKNLPSKFCYFRSELRMHPPETPLHVTQEAVRMLEAYLNISSLRRQKNTESDRGSNVYHDDISVLPHKDHIKHNELLGADQSPICACANYVSQILNMSLDNRERLKKLEKISPHFGNTTTHLKDTCSFNCEIIPNKIPLQSMNGSFAQKTKINGFFPRFDNVDGLSAKSRQSDSLYNSVSIEPVSPPVFEIPIQIPDIKTGSSLSKRFVMKDDSVSSSIMRYHSVCSGSAEKTHTIPEIEEWSVIEVNSHHNEYTRRSSVKSAPEDVQHCLRIIPKRSATKKWFKFRLPKSGFNLKSHIGNKLSTAKEEIFELNSVFMGTSSHEKASTLEKEYNGCAEVSGTLFPPIPNRKLSTNIINKPNERLHHPTLTNVCAQLFPRLFRQNESSSNYLSSGFFPRIQRLSTNTIRRVKRKKRTVRKLDKISTQASVEEQEEEFRLLPLYTKRRSSKFSHHGNVGLIKNKGNLLVKEVEYNLLNRSNHSSDKEFLENDSFNTPIMNSKTWPIGSPSSKVSGEIACLYRGLIETIGSDKLIESTSQTWSHFTHRKPQSSDKTNVPSFNLNSVMVQCDKSNKSTFDFTINDLSTMQHCTIDHTKVTDEIVSGREATDVALKNTTISSKPNQANKSSTKNELFFNKVTQNLENCAVRNSSNSSELQNELKVENFNHSSTNDNTHYPYAKYVAAMVDALSERLMGKISEDDLELRFQTLEAEASKAAKHKNAQFVKRERFYSVSNGAENLRCQNSLENTTRGNSSSDENIFNNRTERNELKNRRCHSVTNFFATTKSSDLHNASSLESSQRNLKYSCLEQVKRLQLRNKLIITEDLLNRLVNHTNYPNFEADILDLLGRQPNWHRIAILYYLTRCSVRHILNLHIEKLETIQESTSSSSMLRQSININSDSEEIDGSYLQSSGSKSPPSNFYPSNSTYETIIRDTGQCRANIGRIKDYTITFFTRWYADWVYKRGGWLYSEGMQIRKSYQAARQYKLLRITEQGKNMLE
ncbi:unnamed protein product [Schistosoma haematobium]|nr:unnamed protein product [Schistosoma haematobium]